MNLHAFSYEVDELVRHYGMPKDHREWASRMYTLGIDMLTQPTSVVVQCLKGLHPSDRTPEQVRKIMGDAITLYMFEFTALYQKVVIRVEDAGLVRALAGAEIDAAIEDVRAPYPITEWQFPQGIEVSPGYELTACLLFDQDRFDWAKFWGEDAARRFMLTTDRKQAYCFLTRLRKKGVDDEAGCSWIRFDAKDHPLSTLQPTQHMEPDEDATLKASCRTVLALCLYLQMEECQNGRGLSVTLPVRRQGVCPDVGRLLKKRPYRTIRNLLPPELTIHTGEHRTVTGRASPSPHWRKLHLRTLRSDRFRRNADGSVRVVWVKPALIKSDAATGTVKVETHHDTCEATSQ